VTGRGPDAGDGRPALLAVRAPGATMRIRPASAERAWMQTEAGRYAKRCLPLLMANQSGWELLNPHAVTAVWDGGDTPAALKVMPHLPTGAPGIVSHFGLGVLTWHLPFAFRTPPGYNMLVRGPANQPKDGAAPLEGLVETDWSSAMFTMNWKLTRPGHPVTFEAGEAFAMIVPARRGELERFEPALRSWASEPEVAAGAERFSSSRMRFLDELAAVESAAGRHGWQRDYMLGRDVDGTPAIEHETRRQLAPFE
jgi:hypothetical protein